MGLAESHAGEGGRYRSRRQDQRGTKETLKTETEPKGRCPNRPSRPRAVLCSSATVHNVVDIFPVGGLHGGAAGTPAESPAGPGQPDSLLATPRAPAAPDGEADWTEHSVTGHLPLRPDGTGASQDTQSKPIESSPG